MHDAAAAAKRSHTFQAAPERGAPGRAGSLSARTTRGRYEKERVMLIWTQSRKMEYEAAQRIS
jgi:hypothetical protein